MTSFAARMGSVLERQQRARQQHHTAAERVPSPPRGPDGAHRSSSSPHVSGSVAAAPLSRSGTPLSGASSFRRTPAQQRQPAPTAAAPAAQQRRDDAPTGDAAISVFDRITFTCAECGAKNQRGSHCGACDAALPLLTQCRACGAAARGHFCSSCGERLPVELASPSRRHRRGAEESSHVDAFSPRDEPVDLEDWQAVEQAWRTHRSASSQQHRSDSNPGGVALTSRSNSYATTTSRFH